MPIPVLETARLILRPLRAGDAHDMFEYAQDPALARLGMWDPYDSFEACEQHIEHLIPLYEKRLMWWAIEHRADKRLIGRVELAEWDPDNEHAELGYALNRNYWGQGLMTEAVALAVDYGWTQLALHRLGATVLPENTASIRLLTRIGMKREGRLRDYRRLAGEWVDVDVYGMLRTDSVS